MYIIVSDIVANYNPNSIYLVCQVMSSLGTNTTIEVFIPIGSSADDINNAVASEARESCRSNNETVANDQPVTILGGAIIVS